MHVNNDQFLPSHSVASSFNSLGYPLNQVFGFAIQAVIAGSSAAGTAKLQISVDPNTNSDPSYQPTNWTDYAGSSQTVAGSGNIVWNVDAVYFNWVRIAYTAASGTGTMVANINTKAN